MRFLPSFLLRVRLTVSISLLASFSVVVAGNTDGMFNTKSVSRSHAHIFKFWMWTRYSLVDNEVVLVVSQPLLRRQLIVTSNCHFRSHQPRWLSTSSPATVT